VPRRAPGALIRYKEHVAGEVYPAHTDLTPNRLDPDGYLPKDVAAKSQLSWTEADVQPELRGFAYCDHVQNIDGLPSYINVAINMHRIVNRINGEVIEEYPPRATGNGRTRFDFALERDEYIYLYRDFGLVNIFGGL